MTVQIEASWKVRLQDYFATPAWQELTDFVRAEYQSKTIYPHPKNMFNAFDTTPFDDVRVVILGQDPYHGPGQAHGLCFSVQNNTPPPSLKNIFKEIQSDLGRQPQAAVQNGDLTDWARQGVFLLNAVLTVPAGQAAGHAGKGWEEFTDYVIKKLSDEKEGLVFLLWGNYAKQKGQHIDRFSHTVLEASHPSPLGAHKGFMGCKHFSLCNEVLAEQNQAAINW